MEITPEMINKTAEELAIIFATAPFPYRYDAIAVDGKDTTAEDYWKTLSDGEQEVFMMQAFALIIRMDRYRDDVLCRMSDFLYFRDK